MDSSALPNELDVLRDVSRRLTESSIPFMLTGSLALSFYAIPRMTRDIDLVVEVDAIDGARLAGIFQPDYYVSVEAINEAIESESMFNAIHRASIVKVDCIPRKASEYHLLEFSRRLKTTIADFSLWVVSREDLILSKLMWARESRSEIQLSDIRNLLSEEADVPYIDHWASRLGVADLWRELSS